MTCPLHTDALQNARYRLFPVPPPLKRPAFPFQFFRFTVSTHTTAPPSSTAERTAMPVAIYSRKPPVESIRAL